MKDLLKDPMGHTSSIRVALFVWTFVPLFLWVYFSVRHDMWIPLTDMGGLDLILLGVSTAIGAQHWAKRDRGDRDEGTSFMG